MRLRESGNHINSKGSKMAMNVHSTKLTMMDEVEPGSIVFVPRHQSNGIVFKHADKDKATRFLLMRDERGVFFESSFPHPLIWLGDGARLKVEFGTKEANPSSPAESIGLFG